jgi:hypothetical protein
MFSFDSTGATGAVAATAVLRCINDQKLLLLNLGIPMKAHPEDQYLVCTLLLNVPFPRHNHSGHAQNVICVEFYNGYTEILDDPGHNQLAPWPLPKKWHG